MSVGRSASGEDSSCFAASFAWMKRSYRLDVRDIALRGGDSGETAIVPHDAKRSPLIRHQR